MVNRKQAKPLPERYLVFSVVVFVNVTPISRLMSLQGSHHVALGEVGQGVRRDAAASKVELWSWWQICSQHGAKLRGWGEAYTRVETRRINHHWCSRLKARRPGEPGFTPRLRAGSVNTTSSLISREPTGDPVNFGIVPGGQFADSQDIFPCPGPWGHDQHHRGQSHPGDEKLPNPQAHAERVGDGRGPNRSSDQKGSTTPVVNGEVHRGSPGSWRSGSTPPEQNARCPVPWRHANRRCSAGKSGGPG